MAEVLIQHQGLIKDILGVCLVSIIGEHQSRSAVRLKSTTIANASRLKSSTYPEQN